MAKARESAGHKALRQLDRLEKVLVSGAATPNDLADLRSQLMFIAKAAKTKYLKLMVPALRAIVTDMRPAGRMTAEAILAAEEHEHDHRAKLAVDKGLATGMLMTRLMDGAREGRAEDIEELRNLVCVIAVESSADSLIPIAEAAFARVKEAVLRADEAVRAKGDRDKGLNN